MNYDEIGRCAFCGCGDPRESFCFHYDDEKRLAVRLWCADERACNQRQAIEEAWATAHGPRLQVVK